MTKKESKYLRTQMYDGNGKIVPARINKHTGEVTPYNYRTPQPPCTLGGRKPDADSIEPFWLKFVGVERTTVGNHRTDSIDSSKSIVNPYYGMLDQYDMYENRSSVGLMVAADEELNEDQMDDAIISLVDNLPYMDNIFTGVSHLGDHNALSKNVMFRLLRSLPEISSNTIYQNTTYSAVYCRRLAAALRVFIKLTASH